MTKRNITLTSILLLVLVIIIGSSLAIAKANVLGAVGLGLKHVGATSVYLHDGLDAVDDRVAVADLRNLRALNEVVLDVEVDELADVTLSVLHV